MPRSYSRMTSGVSPRGMHTGPPKLQIFTRLARGDLQSLVDDVCTFWALLQRFVGPQPTVNIPVMTDMQAGFMTNSYLFYDIIVHFM